MILNKFIAHCGVSTRRQAGDLVKAGKVKVNGKVESNPAYRVQKEDVIEYEGKKLSLKVKMQYVLLNKPKDFVTSSSDEKEERKVVDLVKNHLEEKVLPVGQLDKATTGLLLLTNDEELSLQLTNPKFGIKNAYHVQLHTDLADSDFKLIKRGLKLEDEEIKLDEITYKSEEEKDRIEIQLHSGRHGVIRRLFDHYEYKVKSLDRVYFAGLTKKGLPRGKWRFLTEKELRMLKHFTK